MKTSRSIATLLALAFFASTMAFSADKPLKPHDPYALILGTIYGPDDRPVSGVKIKMRREGEKKTIDLVSDARGEFAHRFPAGKADYVIWADVKDKKTAEKSQVKVHIEKDERQDLTLHLTK